MALKEEKKQLQEQRDMLLAEMIREGFNAEKNRKINVIDYRIEVIDFRLSDNPIPACALVSTVNELTN